MQKDPVVVKASELLRLGLMPSSTEIRAGKVRALSLIVRVPAVSENAIPGLAVD